jgi:iron(III) transport system substrate-binding protein
MAYESPLYRLARKLMSRIIAAAVAVLVSGIAGALAQVPSGYPAEYAQVIEAGKREGKLTVYSTTDSAAAAQLLRDFAELYPQVRVDYVELNSGELYTRFQAELAANADTADLLWASSMDGQVKLADAGQAATYVSPELPALPKWAVWRNQAYGTTYEPITFVYNKQLLPAADVPHDHAALLALLNAKPAAFKGRITAYDPERSGTGYLLANEDIKQFPQAWELFRAFGQSAIVLRTAAADIMQGVIEGEQTIGYGVFGSYARARAERVPDLGIVLPRDYALIMSRVAVISAKARRPNAARLFLDYLLSQRGQNIIASRCDLYAMREDVGGPTTAQGVAELIGDKARPIPIGAELLAPLSEANRREFAKKWRAAMQGQ